MSSDQSSSNVSRIHALSKVSIALSETLSLDKLLYKAVAQCIEILNFDAAVIYFLEPSGKYFVAKHFYGIQYDSSKRLRKLPTDFIGGLVIKNGKTVITEDFVRFHQQRPQLEGFKSLISVPIKARREAIGVLDVFTKEHRDFNPEDISLIESIGLQIGVASENAKLFESIDNVTTKLRELVTLNQRLSSCLNLDSLVHLLTMELSKVFKAKVLFLSLGNDQDIQVNTSYHYNGITLAYDPIMKSILQGEPNTVHSYQSNQGNIELDHFFEKLNMKRAEYVNFIYGENNHCLIIGNSYDYQWSTAEREVMEGISKTISLALTNSYLFLEVEKSRERNSNLRALQIAAQEKERQRIAGEIHDSINQSLSGIYFHLQYCRDEIEHSPEKVKAILDKLLSITKENINELRQVIHDLHPLAIQKFGFVGAVDQLVKTCTLEEIIDIQLNVTGQPFRYEPEVEIHLYRVIQECMNNIIKHSEAEEALITMQFEHTELRIIIEDDGVGFEADQKLRGNHAYGIMGMETRIRDIGGEMSISSQIGKGTKVEVILCKK
ncbi:histidine kinase [Brevibacillus sp. NRS-1366]|uniref:GAF domain-containing sensor histidine kinase n=1 Tax=Brevibacillus sp. NRS-1366 TaxID=3233899 RepID=UPI003D2483DB